MIESKICKVFYAPTKGRRYFTKKAAIHNEARAIIYKHYPRENYPCTCGSNYCDCGAESIDIFEDNPDYAQRKYNLLVKALFNVL